MGDAGDAVIHIVRGVDDVEQIRGTPVDDPVGLGALLQFIHANIAAVTGGTFNANAGLSVTGVSTLGVTNTGALSSTSIADSAATSFFLSEATSDLSLSRSATSSASA